MVPSISNDDASEHPAQPLEFVGDLDLKQLLILLCVGKASRIASRL
jgi:hypothetical protein